MSEPRSRLPRVVVYVAAWVVAAGVAVAVGVLAVSSAGDSVRDRGALGADTEVARQAQIRENADVDPGEPVDVDELEVEQSKAFEDEFGRFVVGCVGTSAVGLEVVPATGWRTVSFEEGPDDDVDAVFSSGGRSIEIEVFCNGGTPTIGDREVKTLPETDD